MSNNELSSQTLQEQIILLSQISLSTTDQFEYVIEDGQSQAFLYTMNFRIPINLITRECIVCVIEKSFDQFEGIYGDACAHFERTVCNSCVYENTKCRIEDSMIYYENVVCPEPNCHGVFDYYGIQQILLFIGKNNALFEQYDQHLIYCNLEKIPEFIWCAYGCGSGQMHDLVEASNSIVTCVKCNRRICFKHRAIWHTDMSCDQYDLLTSQPSENDANNKWLELFAKQYPQCQWYIQKNEGCDHMTCRYCKHQFCWECFVDYRLIADKGQSQHETSCSHYQVKYFHIIGDNRFQKVENIILRTFKIKFYL